MIRTKFFYYFIGLNAFLFISCKEKVLSVRLGDYLLNGDIKIKGNDTLYEGLIQYYNTRGDLVSQINFKDNKRNGSYKTYHPNKNIESEGSYLNDHENDESKVYDSSGQLMFKNYYYYGRQIGGVYNYDQKSIYYYRFFTFDGWEIYSCKYKRDNIDTLLETGNLLNYITNYKEVDGLTKIELFFYLVNPPHKHISFTIYDLNLDTNDSTIISVIETNESNMPFKVLDLDVLKPNHKYIINGEAYYPKEDVKIQFLKDEEKELKLPRSRFD